MGISTSYGTQPQNWNDNVQRQVQIAELNDDDLKYLSYDDRIKLKRILEVPSCLNKCVDINDGDKLHDVYLGNIFLRSGVISQLGRDLLFIELDIVPDLWYTAPLQESFMNPRLLAPGSNGQPITRKGSVLDRDQFEAMKDEYYRLRGWDAATGLQTESKLAELGLADVASELKKLNLMR